MRSIKLNTVKTIFGLSLITLLLSACSQEQKQSEQEQTMSTTESTLVEVPSIDIHTAVLQGNLPAVQQHVKAGSDLNVKEPMGGSTPLITAITFDRPEIAKALINAGADLEVQNNDGSTALHVAAFFCRTEMAQILVDANVDKSKQNKYGATALQTISGPFSEMKPVYEMMQVQLGPLGLNLDLEEIEKTRPVVAEILK